MVGNARFHRAHPSSGIFDFGWFPTSFSPQKPPDFGTRRAKYLSRSATFRKASKNAEIKIPTRVLPWGRDYSALRNLSCSWGGFEGFAWSRAKSYFEPYAKRPTGGDERIAAGHWSAAARPGGPG